MVKVKQKKIWDIFKYPVKRINVIERRERSRNESMIELIVEKWYYVLVFAKECGSIKRFFNWKMKEQNNKNQRTKESKNHRTKDLKNQRTKGPKDQRSKEQKN